MPAFCNVLCDTRAEAMGVPRGNIRLGFCGSCGLITNLSFESQQMHYGQSYENSLHFSPRFSEYADKLAERLVETYGLHNKSIVEIACGKGDFLTKLCELGNNRGIGFDPSYTPDASQDNGSQRITFIREVFSERHIPDGADFFCCRHALEHIADPITMLRQLRQAMGDRTERTAFFEVPNALATLRESAIWDVLYEHCTYFVPESLRLLFVRSGFDVLDVSEEYEGQFVTIAARPGAHDQELTALHDETRRKLASDVRAFGGMYSAKIDAWRCKLREMRECGERTVVWGSGTKGVMFLNTLQSDPCVEYIVDINPRKHNKHVVGTGQLIVAPEFLVDYRPDVVIVMNAVYRDEISGILARMQLHPRVLVA